MTNSISATSYLLMRTSQSFSQGTLLHASILSSKLTVVACAARLIVLMSKLRMFSEWSAYVGAAPFYERQTIELLSTSTYDIPFFLLFTNSTN